MMAGVVAGFSARGLWQTYTVTVEHRPSNFEYGFQLPLWYAGVGYGDIAPMPVIGNGIVLRSAAWYYGSAGARVKLAFQRPNFSNNTLTVITQGQILALVDDITISGTNFRLIEADIIFESPLGSATTVVFDFLTALNPFGTVGGAQVPLRIHYL